MALHLIRVYILPERIGVMTMRPLTLHREEDGRHANDGRLRLSPGRCDAPAQRRMRCSRKSFSKKSVIRDSAPSLTSSFAPNR
jgi:hypothetical protein